MPVPSQKTGFPMSYAMVFVYVQRVEMVFSTNKTDRHNIVESGIKHHQTNNINGLSSEFRGDCSFCCYLWNYWPSLFKLSSHNSHSCRQNGTSFLHIPHLFSCPFYLDVFCSAVHQNTHCLPSSSTKYIYHHLIHQRHLKQKSSVVF